MVALLMRVEAPPPVAAAPAAAAAAPRAPTAIADLSLKTVPNSYRADAWRPESIHQRQDHKQLKGRVVVVLDKANAAAIMRAPTTGRSVGLRDDSTASITLIDSNETVVMWASEAVARGGQRKVADRLVNNLKKALNKAK